MEAVMLQLLASFHANFSKIFQRLFISANTYEKFVKSKDFCLAYQVDKMFFLPDCRYHNLLTRDVDELLQEFDALFYLPTRALPIYAF